MAKRMKVGDKRPVRPIGDGFEYTNTRFDTPDAFKKRMTDRAIVAVWDQAHEANRERDGIVPMRPIRVLRSRGLT
jgi:hypothetical protein